MHDITILRITSNNMSYGGRHDGTYSVDENGVRNLRELLQRAYDDLCSTTPTDPHPTAHDTIEALARAIDHIDEYAPDIGREYLTE